MKIKINILAQKKYKYAQYNETTKQYTYICPACNTEVAKLDTSCDNCGQRFLVSPDNGGFK